MSIIILAVRSIFTPWTRGLTWNCAAGCGVLEAAMPLFGAHESIAGGLHLAFDRIRKVGGECLQIFTRNQRQWKAAPLRDEEVEQYHRAWQASGRLPVASHASYLINLAARAADARAKGLAAFSAELVRCRRLSIPYVVIHPGSHLGAGVEAGIETVAANIDAALSGADANGPMILLETTAGQGTGLGATFRELAAIRRLCEHGERVGCCFDTCHVFAAGYPLDTETGYHETMDAFDREIGLEHLRLFHVNDSKRECGSRVDRHEHIGKGRIGPDGFRLLVRDPRFRDHAMILETDKGEDLEDDRRNLAALRALL